MNKKFYAIPALALALSLGACGAANMGDGGGQWMYPELSGDFVDASNYSYAPIEEQAFHDAATEPASYFSLDRNTANYAMVRSQIEAGRKVASDSVRIEELMNYFTFEGYPMPEEGEEISLTSYLMDCPWNEAHKLGIFGVRTAPHTLDSARNSYTFLIDVSGSMSWKLEGKDRIGRLDLIKLGIEELLTGLEETDSVSIVTYAAGVKTVLEPTYATGEGKSAIMRAVNELESGGSTNGAGGLEAAYALARSAYAEGGNNRVILMSDGDFNVGMSDTEALKTYIREKAEGGVYLSVIGVGMGNMRDDLLEALALSGNGNYAYIDSPLEAKKVLSEELAGMLFTVAKDAKAGVTFRPDAVEKYRILGYDMKTMSEDDFRDPEKDAGEIGSDLCVSVMYELQLKETQDGGTMPEDAPLASAEIRYRSAADGEEKNAVCALTLSCGAGEDQAFLACVAEWGLLLRNSIFRAGASFEAVEARLSGLSAYLARDAYKAEFAKLVTKAKESGFYGRAETAPGET